MTTPTTQTGVFVGYNLDDLRALVLRMLRVSNTARFSSTEGTADYGWIDDVINRGQEEFARRTKCLRSYAVIELLSGHRTYRLPYDVVDIMAVYYYDTTLTNGYKELTITTVEEMNDDISDWRTDSDEPVRVYIDRNFGAGLILGINPIPESDGEVISFSSSYGAAVTWICPLYKYNRDQGTIVKVSGVDEWILANQAGVSIDPPSGNKDLVVEYYRLPQILVEQGDDGTQKTEIPREYQRAIAYYAAADLLLNNPADSAEFKRSQYLMSLFEREVAIYLDKRKAPFSGHNLQTRPMVWNWTKNMQHMKDLV